MAGTGHSYEIANIGEVRRVVVDLTAQAGGERTVSAWLAAKPFLRYLTSDKFTFRVRRNASPAFLDTSDKTERDFIARKWKDGQEIRVFSGDHFTRTGPDMPHVFDYLADLRLTRPSDYERISRISPEDLFKKVEKWIQPKSKKTTLREGNIRKVVETADGNIWYELLDVVALAAEGDAMCHCVDSAAYALSLEDGAVRIFSMRNPEGRRLLTMELEPRLGGIELRVVQIQAYRNTPPPDASIDSICSILNHLGVEHGSSGQERRARVCRTSEGVWQSIYKTWERIERFGLDAITNGEDTIFMSPVHPDRQLVSIEKTSVLDFFAELLRDEDDIEPARNHNLSAVLPTDRHLPLEELDAACRIINEMSAAYDDSRLTTDAAGKCIPWARSLTEVKGREDTTYFRCPRSGNLYVTSLADPALVLAEIHLDTAAKVFAAHRWADQDALNCAAAMTDGKAANIGGDHPVLAQILKRFGISRLAADHSFRAFNIEANTHRSRRDGFRWLETEYKMVLLDGDEHTADFALDNGTLLKLPWSWNSTYNGMEIASRFNKLKVRPSDNVIPASSGNKLPMTGGSATRVVCVRGKWSAVRNQRALLKLVGTPSGFTIGEARIILSLLPDVTEERLPETAHLFATCVAVTSDLQWELLNHNNNEREKIFWLVESGLALLADDLRSSVMSDVKDFLEKWAARPKDVQKAHRNEIRLFLAVWKQMPKRIVNMVILHLFRKNYMSLGHHAEDVVWVREIYPTIGNKEVRWVLYDRIDFGASAFSEISDPHKLLVHAECLAFYACYESLMLDHKTRSVTEAYERLAAAGVPHDKKNVMNEIQTIIASIPDIVAKREAEIARRRAERDRMFRGNSNLEPGRKAA